MNLEKYIDLCINNLQKLKKTLKNESNEINYVKFDNEMNVIMESINKNLKMETIVQQKSKLVILEEEIQRMSSVVIMLYKQLYKTNLSFENNINNYKNTLNNTYRKNVNIGNNNFINLLYVEDINNITEDFTFYFVNNINEVVLRFTNNNNNKFYYVNFKLEKISYNEDKNKMDLTRLDNCKYGSNCTNGNLCKFYHNPIEFNNKSFHKYRNHYPNYLIKNCPNFGDVDLVKNQVLDWSELQNNLQRAGFTIIAAACCQLK